VCQAWPALRSELAALVGDPAAIAAGLRAVGAPTRFGELGVDAGRARWAVGASHLMRERFTVADLMFLAGRFGPDDVASVLGEAALLGGGV
jgi:glycerol-1-phosphate dehydrogenase [NAD(P)+]